MHDNNLVVGEKRSCPDDGFTNDTKHGSDENSLAKRVKIGMEANDQLRMHDENVIGEVKTPQIIVPHDSNKRLAVPDHHNSPISASILSQRISLNTEMYEVPKRNNLSHQPLGLEFRKPLVMNNFDCQEKNDSVRRFTHAQQGQQEQGIVKTPLNDYVAFDSGEETFIVEAYEVLSNPDTMSLFTVMTAIFFINISTTYLFLLLIFTRHWKVTFADESHSVTNQLQKTILFNLVATFVFLKIIRPRSLIEFPRNHKNVIPPAYYTKDSNGNQCNMKLSNMTLRQFLRHPEGFHLALAPAFFGFYAYFGALITLNESVLTKEETEDGKSLLSRGFKNKLGGDPLLKSVSGASAGAMAAILLASGLNPRDSTTVAGTIKLSDFADFPGIGGLFRGDLFEKLMMRQLQCSSPNLITDVAGALDQKLQLEHGCIPVAVSVFDLLTMRGKILTRGCMSKAARASATFPLLFQPCYWDVDTQGGCVMDEEGYFDNNQRYLLIDGGVRDRLGLAGLGALRHNESRKRVVNISVGTMGSSGCLGPTMMPKGVNASKVVSISIENTPLCGPWSMLNGPRAAEAARKAMKDVLDARMYVGREEGHYIVRVDSKSFIPM